MFNFVSSYYNVLFFMSYYDILFMCKRFRQNTFVNSHSYFNYCNIIKFVVLNPLIFKYVDLIIKYTGFESFYYAINLDTVSLFMVFSDIDYLFLSIYYRFK